MLSSQARVRTARPGRYLVRLCRHLEMAGWRHPHLRARVEWSDDHGLISLVQSRCYLRASPGVLMLRVEAPDEPSLHRIEHHVGGRLGQIGRRDGLTVTWVRFPAAETESGGGTPRPTEGTAT